MSNEKGATPNRPITDEDIKMAETMVQDGTKPDDLPGGLKEAYLEKHKPDPDTQPPATTGDQPAPKPEKKEVTPEPPVDEGEEAKPEKEGTEKPPEGSKDTGKDKGSAVEPPEPRPVRAVPVAKYRDLKNTFKDKETDYLKTISDLKAELGKRPTQTDQEFDKKLTEAAEKLGLEKEGLKVIIDLAAEKYKVPQEVLDRISTTDKTAQQQAYWQKQDEKYEEEFLGEVADLATNNPEEAKLMEANKAKIKEFAFTEGFDRKSNWEIWTRYVKPDLPKPGRKTGETGGATPQPPKFNKDWEKVKNDPVALKALTREEFIEFDKYMERTYGGMTVRRARVI